MTHQATPSNLALLRAVAKQTLIHDRTDINYRRKLPTENSWDLVALETGEPVEQCKQQWRKLRNDYTRFVNLDAKRKRLGQKRVPHPLASELRFLGQHLYELNKSSAPPEPEADISQSEGHLEKYNGKESGKEREKDPEVSGCDESYLEEHLEGDLIGFDSDQGESNQNPMEPSSPEKLVTGTESRNSPASHSEFFVKQNRDPRLRAIERRKTTEQMNDYEEDLNSRDPRIRRNREGSDALYSPWRRSQPVRRSSMSVREVPISRPTPVQRVTHDLKRRKSMGMAVQQSVWSSTSPVKIPPVPRTVMPVKQTQFSVKPVQSRGDIFPRQESSSPAGGTQFSEDAVRQQNQSTSATVATSTESTNRAGSVSDSAYSTPSHITVDKCCERSIQTACPDITSDDHFFALIWPQMKEMNQRQKLMFKTKVFRAVIETFDDATDFPMAGEQQHFNINTPSGFEHITDPELRLMRELVSLVTAAKITIIGPAEAAAKPPHIASPGLQRLQQPQTQAKLVQQQPRQVVQRLFKPGQAGAVGLTASQGGPGQERANIRFMNINGKPNTLVCASLEDLLGKESGAGVKVVQPQAMNPRGGTVVTSVRPAASPLNALFGQSLPVPPPQSVQQTQPMNQLNAPTLRSSVCGNGNPMMPNSAMLSANMESLAIKRPQASPGRGVVLQGQRPRSSASGAGVGQLVIYPQAGNVQMRYSLGAVQANQKQVLSPSGVLTPQITHVQGNAFNDIIQPSAAPSVTSNSSRENSPLVVANAKNAQADRRYSSEIAGTIAADDFSLSPLKSEPGEIEDDTTGDIFNIYEVK